MNQKFENTASLTLSIETTFVKNSCLVVTIVSFNNAGLHILTFRILETYPSKDIKLDLRHVISH